MAAAPLRRCRVCRRQAPQTELQRWTAVDGAVRPDEGVKAPGRGYYSCSAKCAEILPKTIKKK